MIPQPEISLLRVGKENCPVIVIDGFSRDPERWRAMAIDADYRAMGDYYPGRRAPVPEGYFADVGPLLGAIFRKGFGCTGQMTVERALYSIVSTAPEDLGLAQRIPHIDRAEPDHFAAVHFLSHTDWGGTAFYRHRGSGLAVITQDRHRSYLDRLEQEFAQQGLPEAGYINASTPMFEQIGAIEHRFNRAVLYPSNLLHCSHTANDLVYPDDPLTGRLTVAAFMFAR